MDKIEFGSRWRQMMDNLQEYRGPEIQGSRNSYMCSSCGNVDIYIYRDTGTTPFITTCSRCDGDSQSTMMRDLFPLAPPNREWYRPKMTETLLLKGWKQEHVLSGGLLHRTIDKRTSIFKIRHKA